MPVMPIDSYAPPANLNARDVSATFLKIRKEQTPFFNLIKSGKAAFNTKHVWWDDARLIRGTTIGAAYATGTPTAMTVVSTAGLRAGMYIEIVGVIYKITSVTNATTLVVAYIGGNANTINHAIGAVVNFIGNAAVEGEDYVATDYNFEIERGNLTQIITDYVKITGTDRSIRREANDGDLLVQMTQKKLERLYLYLARAAWVNPILSAPVDNSTPRVMGGIDAYLTANGINSLAATALTTGAFDDWLLQLDKAGANLTQLWMNPLDLKKFVAINASQIQMQRGDTGRGWTATSYESNYGHQLALMTDIQAPAGKIRAITPDQVELCPLVGRQFQLKELDQTGDSEKRMLVGEYTLEIHNSAISGYFVPA